MREQGVVVPENLALAAQDEPDLRRWIASLPETLASVCDRWGLTPGTPFQPGGTCSWVAPALRGSCEGLVLKVTWPHTESQNEAGGLRTWDGHGAVRILADEQLGGSTVMLLERCRPGTPLAQLLDEPEQDVVLASLLPRLWDQPFAAANFRPLADMVDTWAGEFQDGLLDAPDYMDLGLAADGIATFKSLARDSSDPVLLCTDLHAGNILSAEREPWLVVDPKPYLGDRTYDAVQHVLNCSTRLNQEPVALLQRLAALLDLDVSRLRAWVYARCIQASLDWPALYPVALALAP